MKTLSVSLVKLGTDEIKQQFNPMVIEKAKAFDNAAIFLRAALHSSGIEGQAIDRAFQDFGKFLGLAPFLSAIQEELKLQNRHDTETPD